MVRRLLAAAAFLFSVTSQAQVVISQVYGGGGNTGATYKNDFIELFNRGGAGVNLAGWSVQYGPSTGNTWQKTDLTNITLAPGQYYLIQEAPGAGGTTNLPTADASGTIAMAAGAAKVVLISNNTLIASGVTCPTGAAVLDIAGYGTGTNCSETSPTVTLTNTTAAIRAGGGCTDTNNNSADFAAAAPNPRNTGAAQNPCGAAPALSIGPATISAATLNQPYTATFTATGGSGSGYSLTLVGSPSFPTGITFTPGTNSASLSGTPTSGSGSSFPFSLQLTDSASNSTTKAYSLTVNAAFTCTPTHTIAQIQGSGIKSPLANSTAITTTGIVTALRSNGFYLQMPAPGDGDPNTSDGIFVFTSSAPATAVGNSVCVSGQVQEFAPASDANSPTSTEISGSPTVTTLSTGNALPPAVVLSTSDTGVNSVFNLEKYEHMRVQVNSLTVVAPTQGTIAEASATSTSNGFFYGVITGTARPFREPGIPDPDPLPNPPCCIPRWDANPEILQVDSKGQVGSSSIEVTSGALITNLVGVLDYSRRAYTLVPDPATPPGVSGNVSFTAVPLPNTNELTIASFNLERFFDTVDDPGVSDVALTPTAFNNRLNKASLAIRNVLNSPDIIGVEEMENLSTLQSLASKVNTDAGASNPNYQAYLVEGNDVGGIDVGFLVKSARVNVVSVTQFGKDTTYTNPLNGQPELLNDRPPLLLQATIAQGTGPVLPVTVIVNHLRSLSGVNDPVDGPRVRAKREAQAEFLANLIQSRLTANPGENIISIGDYNAFQVNDGYVDVMGVVRGNPVPSSQVQQPPATLLSTPLTDMVDLLPAPQQYSYTFSGSAQVLDHILMDSAALARFTRGACARNDADFPESFRNDPNRPERISDHDMPIAYFTIPVTGDVSAQASVTGSGLLFNRAARTFNGTITVTNSSQQMILGPENLVFQNLPAGVTLNNATGTTAGGDPYLLISTAAINPGQQVTAPVQFKNSGSNAITYTNKVFSGQP